MRKMVASESGMREFETARAYDAHVVTNTLGGEDDLTSSAANGLYTLLHSQVEDEGEDDQVALLLALSRNGRRTYASDEVEVLTASAFLREAGGHVL
jgi:hypothetical protein